MMLLVLPLLLPLALGNMCLSKTYSVFMPAVAEGEKQETCRFKKGSVGGTKFVCDKQNKCSAGECRNKCDAEDGCKYYFYSEAKGVCSLFKGCIKATLKGRNKMTGNTYVKTCSSYAGTIGVSWANMALERWAKDEAAIKAAIEARGGFYLPMDAADDVDQQKQDIEDLVEKHDVDALIVLAIDPTALAVPLGKAKAKMIPVIAYDRLIDDESTFYITFDNVEVGRMQAREVLKAVPTGKYIFIKGDDRDPNADFVHQGQLEVLKAAIDASDITVIGDEYTENWDPANALATMRTLLASDSPNAVVASNDGTAGAAFQALTEKGLTGVALSGQDGDHAALNRVAKMQQTVSVWKDSRVLGKQAGELAVQLARNFQGFSLFATQCGGMQFTTPTDKKVYSLLLAPVAITKDNVDVVVDAGWITSDVLCNGGTIAYCT